MLGWIVLGALLAADWLASLLTDRGAREHLIAAAVRRTLGADSSFETMRRVHESGEGVRPIAMTRIATDLFECVQYGIYGSAYIVMGGLVYFGVSPMVVAACGGLVLGLRGAFPGLGDLLTEGRTRQPKWTRRQLAWWVVAVITRLHGVFLALYLMLAGASMMGGTYSRDPLIAMVWGVVILRLSSLPVEYFMRRAGKRARSTFALEADESTVLLLRSFADDDISVRAMSGVAPLLSPAVPWAKVRFEELIAYGCGTIGNLMAIGRPGEVLPELGATRTYWADDQWQDAIRRTAMRCRAIVVIAGATDGLRWELERLREWRVLGKCLVVLPPDPNEKRALARYAQVVELLTSDGSKLNGQPVSSWVGVRVDHDGHLIHYVADGRDWAAYAAMCMLFNIELSGGWDVSRLKDQKGFADYLTDPSLKGISPVRAIQMASFGYEKSLMTLRKGQDDPFNSEELSRSVLAEVLASLLKVQASWDGESDEQPIPDCDQILEQIDEDKYPGVCAFVHAVRAGHLAQRGDKHDARKDAGRALELAKSCTRVVALPMMRVKPAEISYRAERVFLQMAIEQRDFDAVAKRTRQAAEFAAVAENREDQIEVLITGTRACADGEYWAAAEEFGDAALGLALAMGHSHYEGVARWEMWRVYKSTGRLKEALRAMCRCVELADLLEEEGAGIGTRLMVAATLAALRRPEEGADSIRGVLSRMSAVSDKVSRQKLASNVELCIEYLEKAGLRDGGELRALLDSARGAVEE